MPEDYEKRAQELNLAPPPAVREALAMADTQVIDCRSSDEIAAAAKDTTSVPGIRDGKVDHPNWHQTNCAGGECQEISKVAESMPKPSNEKPVVVIYCRSGRRASWAKNSLVKDYGYSPDQILNAGGYNDVVSILKN